VSEPEFVEYILHTYSHISDEQFYGFLDYCDSETYFSRVRRLRTLFWKLDADGSGVVDAEEKRAYCKKLAHKMGRPLTDDEINEAICDFAFIDKDCDGKVTEEEFITSLLELFEEVDDDDFMKAMFMFDVRSDADRSVIIANLFRRHDLDNDGFWDSREVRIYFQKFGEKNGHHMTEDDLTFSMRQFKAVDRNGDGKVSQEEFVNFFMAETSDITDEEFYDAIEFFDT
jgi:Ca2+-binding EF-hand superfamily protein